MGAPRSVSDESVFDGSVPDGSVSVGARLAAAGVALVVGLAGVAVGVSPALGVPRGMEPGPAPAPVPERYRTVDLGVLRGDGAMVAAMNDHDEVVGFEVTDQTSTVTRAILWSGGRRIDLPTLGGASARALDLNNRGDVVGSAETSSGEKHAVLWSGRQVRDLGTLGGSASQANAISDDGTVVGWATTAAGVTRPFVWRDGRMVDLGELVTSGEPLPNRSAATGVNNHGAIALSIRDGWVVWERGHVARLYQGSLDGNFGTPMINNRGDVAGRVYAGSHQYRVAFYRDGVAASQALNIGGIQPEDSGVLGLNDSGAIVGWCQIRVSDTRELRTVQYLQEYPGAENMGVDLGARGLESTARVRAVNNRNQLAGTVTIDGGTHAALFLGAPGQTSASGRPAAR